MRRPVIGVVDDDATIRRVVRSVLEADGFDVVEAADGPGALELVGRSGGARPGVVVLDVMMPGMDGVEVCRRLDPTRVKTVMLTARDDPITRDASFAAGATAYLVKPFSAIELLDSVERLAG
ncbi:MAG: response regulator transcription factor [Acidimicrobiales bacterium]